jgi:hypothetical protein
VYALPAIGIIVANSLQSPANAQANDASTKDSVTAGPAWLAAAMPVSENRPAPIIPRSPAQPVAQGQRSFQSVLDFRFGLDLLDRLVAEFIIMPLSSSNFTPNTGMPVNTSARPGHV